VKNLSVSLPFSFAQHNPETEHPPHAVYISGRPFVLRDVSEPRKTLALSDRAENLEGIEGRLKQDILVEAGRFGGLVLTHNEVGVYVLPCVRLFPSLAYFTSTNER
jgi:hypothetical protein